MTREITLNYGGQHYRAEIMTVESTKLGYEDHGIFTAILHLRGTGITTSAGGYFFSERRGEHQTGTAYGMSQIMAIAETVGVRTWEEVKGQKVLALYQGSAANCVGIAHLTDDEKVLDFEQWSRDWDHERGPEDESKTR